MTIQHWTPGNEKFLGEDNKFAMQFNIAENFISFHYVVYDPKEYPPSSFSKCVAVFKLKKK